MTPKPLDTSQTVRVLHFLHQVQVSVNAIFKIRQISDQSSDDGRREGLSDSDGAPGPLATPVEKYKWGLLMGKAYSRSNVKVMNVDGRGRSAFADKSFNAGDFVCEYASCVRVKTTPDWQEDRNEDLGIGCYCLDANYKGEAYTFDASSTIKDPGRYINHARRNFNLIKMPPVMIGTPPNQRLRIGFVAKKNIAKGEELFFDYGIRDQEIPWLGVDARQIQTTVDKVEGQEQQVQPKQYRRRPKRVRKDCPYPGCGAKKLVKLADHLHYVHKITDVIQRRDLLQKAKEVQNYMLISL